MKTESDEIKIILFTSSGAETGKRLQRIMEMILPLEQIEIYQSLQSLEKRLQRPMTDSLVFVLLASTPDELIAISELHESLEGRKIIMILPDSDAKSIALGHSLRPRFISYADSDYLEVSVVLNRMTHPYSVHADSTRKRQYHNKSKIDH